MKAAHRSVPVKGGFELALRKVATAVVMLVVMVAPGCSGITAITTHGGSHPIAIGRSTGTRSSEASTSEFLSLKAVSVSEPPAGVHPLTPEEGWLEQVVYQLSNGRSIKPSPGDALWQVSLLGVAVVVATVPSTRSQEFFVMDVRKGGWTFNGIADASLGPGAPDVNENLRGLSLPTFRYLLLPLSASEDPHPYHAWFLSSGNGPVMVLKLESGASAALPATATISAGRSGHHSKEAMYLLPGTNGSWFGVYKDGQFLIICGGSLGKQQALNFAQSLPPATSPTFPLP